ncbi:hypothetical protein MHU86_12807 [Fragilaria crotonensis]|nr:hypothetical protein MHU86_12807 [Fragilaria crotonensis]
MVQDRGCTTDLQLSLANANSFRKLVVLMTTLLLQRKIASPEAMMRLEFQHWTRPNGNPKHHVSPVDMCFPWSHTSENTVAKDTCAQASASSLDCSLTPSDEHAADDPLCDKENVDPVHGVEYTMEELNIVLSKAIAAHKHVDDGSTDSTPPSSPDVSFEDNYLSIDMIFEKFLELLPPGLGLDTSDLIESLPDDEQQYESFADTSTLIDAETTFDTKDGDTIEDTAQDNDVGAYAEMLSSLFSDANKLKEASLAAVAAAETSLLGPLFGHDNPVTSMFSSGEATGACDARQPSNYGLNCDDLQCETWDAQLTENIPIPDVRRIPRDFADEAARRWNFVEGCHGSESRTPNIPSCSLTGMTDQFPNLLCNLDSYKSCDEQNERGGNPDSLVLDPSTHRNGTAVKEPTGPSTVPQTVGLRTGALRNQMNAPAQDDEIIRQGRHSVRVVPYQSGDVEEQQPFDECNAGLACSNSNAKQSCRGPEGSPADDIQDKKSSRNGSTPKVKNTRYGLHQATTPQESSDGSDFGPLLADPVEEEAGAQEYWTSFSNSPFDEFLNAPLRTQPHERVNDFNPFPSQRQSIARSGVGKNTHTSNRQVKTSIHSGKHLHGLTSSRSTPEEKNSASTSKITSSQIGSEPWRSHRFFKPQQRTRSTTKAPHLGSDQVDNSDARRDGKHPKENTTVDLRPSQHDPLVNQKHVSG